MISNGLTIEQELERYKSWLEDRNIELKETKKHLKIVSELLKIHQTLYENNNEHDYDLAPELVEEMEKRIEQLEKELEELK